MTSPATRAIPARTDEADTVTRSVRPVRAVGCGRRVHGSEGRVTHIEGDPVSVGLAPGHPLGRAG